MADPVPPEDVRVVLADGREIPVECVYVGVVDGRHEWEVVHTLPELPTEIVVRRLPGRTTVSFPFKRP